MKILKILHANENLTMLDSLLFGLGIWEYFLTEHSAW